MKLSPNLSVKHVPLLHSIKSQILNGGLRVGEAVRIKDDEGVEVTKVEVGNRISQNSPVYPAKH